MADNLKKIKIEVARLKQEAESQTEWEKKKKILKKMDRLVGKVVNENSKLISSGEYKKHDMEDRFDWSIEIQVIYLMNLVTPDKTKVLNCYG